MPTYEYLCKTCGNQWEEVQRITESATTECPTCHKATAERQISGGTFILKGGGWYADAYSSAKPKSAESKGDAGKSEKTADAKSETKSADAKGETKSADTKSETKSETKAPAPKSPSTTPPAKSD